MICPHFGPPDNCGGCTRQHVAYPEQLRLKTALVQRLVHEAVPHAPDVRATLPATSVDEPWGYRHKVHFVFGGPVMGHYVRGSRRVFQARECPVHDERGNAFAFRLRDELCDSSALRHLVVRVGANTPEMMATLVVSRTDDKRLRAATRRALDGPGAPTSLHLNVHARDDGYIFGRETRRIEGPERMREEVAGVSFLISPTAFFQTNVHAAELLVRLVLDAVPPDVSVLDLYAGAGLFALPLARRGHRVLAIEANRQAVEDGLASARLNRIAADTCRFHAQPVERALRRIAPADADSVVLDPPREGCEREVLDSVFGRLRPARAIYVSCNPEALARDLWAVTRAGYRIDALQPVDMFPHTAHIETVAVLSRLQ